MASKPARFSTWEARKRAAYGALRTRGAFIGWRQVPRDYLALPSPWNHVPLSKRLDGTKPCQCSKCKAELRRYEQARESRRDAAKHLRTAHDSLDEVFSATLGDGAGRRFAQSAGKLAGRKSATQEHAGVKLEEVRQRLGKHGDVLLLKHALDVPFLCKCLGIPTAWTTQVESLADDYRSSESYGYSTVERDIKRAKDPDVDEPGTVARRQEDADACRDDLARSLNQQKHHPAYAPPDGFAEWTPELAKRLLNGDDCPLPPSRDPRLVRMKSLIQRHRTRAR
jgi:hypothetical protein